MRALEIYDEIKKEYDEVRSEYLKTLGINVMRFWNNDVMENLDGVMIMILDALNPDPTLPSPF